MLLYQKTHKSIIDLVFGASAIKLFDRVIYFGVLSPHWTLWKILLGVSLNKSQI